MRLAEMAANASGGALSHLRGNPPAVAAIAPTPTCSGSAHEVVILTVVGCGLLLAGQAPVARDRRGRLTAHAGTRSDVPFNLRIASSRSTVNVVADPSGRDTAACMTLHFAASALNLARS